ncbi:MAG: DUF3160 domain-containing protein [Planctomycetes bacterium]|nr:DUF3160 domain-containing protein [Planctomycetota bacterium]
MHDRGDLHVGFGRPLALYVLYSFKGRELLCRGAVLPYYESSHASRLTDAEWKELLDGPSRPQLPEWTHPLTTH